MLIQMMRTGVLASSVLFLACLTLLATSEDPTESPKLIEFFPTAMGATQAFFQVRKLEAPTAIIVVANGYPGTGEKRFHMRIEDFNSWTDYASTNHLGLVFASFYSPAEALQTGAGYYDAAAGACHLLESRIRQSFGTAIPVYVFSGNSEGGSIVLSLIDSDNDMVKGWCCLGAKFWPKDLKSPRNIPGLLGLQANSADYEEAYAFYSRSRHSNKKWTWLDYRSNEAGKVKDFARDYVLTLIQSYHKEDTEEILYPEGEQHAIRNKELITQAEVTDGSPDYTWLPSSQLANTWSSLNEAHEDRPLVVEKDITLDQFHLPKLEVYLRLPPHQKDASNVAGVLAYCTWISDRKRLFSDVADNPDENAGIWGEMISFAAKHNLAILTWSTPGHWNVGANNEDLSPEDRLEVEQEFNHLADGWDQAVTSLCRQYKLPTNNYLLYGISRGGQWAHRLALRKPDRFLAVNVHISSSYDTPNREAQKILWLVTTGELEPGYERAKKFYTECLAQGYPVMFKAAIGLGHDTNRNINQLRDCFFEYALNIESQRKASQAGDTDKNSLDSTTSIPQSLQNPPYVGDIVNQEYLPVEQIESIPPGFRVPLPTRELAERWDMSTYCP